MTQVPTEVQTFGTNCITNCNNLWTIHPNANGLSFLQSNRCAVLMYNVVDNNFNHWMKLLSQVATSICSCKFFTCNESKVLKIYNIQNTCLYIYENGNIVDKYETVLELYDLIHRLIK
jgi:hypothetical protein